LRRDSLKSLLHSLTKEKGSSPTLKNLSSEKGGENSGNAAHGGTIDSEEYILQSRPQVIRVGEEGGPGEITVPVQVGLVGGFPSIPRGETSCAALVSREGGGEGDDRYIYGRGQPPVPRPSRWGRRLAEYLRERGGRRSETRLRFFSVVHRLRKKENSADDGDLGASFLCARQREEAYRGGAIQERKAMSFCLLPSPRGKEGGEVF